MSHNLLGKIASQHVRSIQAPSGASAGRAANASDAAAGRAANGAKGPMSMRDTHSGHGNYPLAGMKAPAPIAANRAPPVKPPPPSVEPYSNRMRKGAR